MSLWRDSGTDRNVDGVPRVSSICSADTVVENSDETTAESREHRNLLDSFAGTSEEDKIRQEGPGKNLIFIVYILWAAEFLYKNK